MPTLPPDWFSISACDTFNSMSEQIDAIYDNGVLKPLAPLSLPDKAFVKLTVEAPNLPESAVQPQDEWERQLIEVAKDCGVSLPDSAVSSEGLYE